MGRVKQWRQLTTSTTHLAQKLLKTVPCSGGSGSFAKETRALKMQGIEAGHWKLTTDQLRAIFEAEPCTTTWEAAKELNVDLSKVVQHLKQIWKVKKLSKWVSCELKKKSSFWSVIFYYSMQQQRTISLSDCDVWCKGDCICQLAMTSSVAGPRSSKELPIAKSNLHQTKVTVTV